jgi:predicted SAM-dependent methyltransferase
MDTNEIRYDVSAPYLQGKGIEIGAGMAPQRLPEGAVCEYFDKRTATELSGLFGVSEKQIGIDVHPIDSFWSRFPEGADFVIAHHVLEHCSNPLSALIKWQSYLKNEGTLVISVPDAKRCPDAGRLIPPLDHLLEDYIFDRGDDSFESREHIYSFVMGWIDKGFAEGKEKFEIARITHQCARAPKNDLHWHAFDNQLLMEVIFASGRISGNKMEVKAVAAPDDKESPTQMDMICVCKVHHGKTKDRLYKKIAEVRETLSELFTDLSPVELTDMANPVISPSIPEYAMRELVADRFIRGNGIEIGAMHHPLALKENTNVRYVDILTIEEHLKRDPSMDACIRVDIVDDGESLEKIDDESLDFIVANHFLEHCQNPLGTIRNHLRKLSKGGILFYAVPNKDHTFDRERPVTSFDHLLEDDLRGAEISKVQHYREWAMYVDKLQDFCAIEEKVGLLAQQDLRIHFHVWDKAALMEFYRRSQEYLSNAFRIETVLDNYSEVIAVLRKTKGI